MKKYILIILFVLAISSIISENIQAQSKSYNEGSVWEISLIKTKAPYFDDYMNNLSAGWKKVMDEAKKQGLILSYMVLSQSPSRKDDWDLALLIEYKNMAALDGIEEKMEKIENNLFGDQKSIQQAAVNRNELRELLGNRLARQLIFK